jgi:hypothetical protein
LREATGPLQVHESLRIKSTILALLIKFVVIREQKDLLRAFRSRFFYDPVFFPSSPMAQAPINALSNVMLSIAVRNSGL